MESKKYSTTRAIRCIVTFACVSKQSELAKSTVLCFQHANAFHCIQHDFLGKDALFCGKKTQ
jgi:hypothetical protein